MNETRDKVEKTHRIQSKKKKKNLCLSPMDANLLPEVPWASSLSCWVFGFFVFFFFVVSKMSSHLGMDGIRCDGH